MTNARRTSEYFSESRGQRIHFTPNCTSLNCYNQSNVFIFKCKVCTCSTRHLSVGQITTKGLLWCCFRRRDDCQGAVLVSTTGGIKTSLFLTTFFSTFPPLTPYQDKVTNNHPCPHTRKNKSCELDRPGQVPPRRQEGKLLYGLAAGRGCLGSLTNCRNPKGLQKGGLICYSVPGQGQWSRRGGAEGACVTGKWGREGF